MSKIAGIFDPVMRGRLWRRWTSLPHLRCQIRAANRPKIGSGPVLFAVMRNEMLRLPRFLDHYRRLGITRFFVVENNSSDETPDYLLSQPDVVLYRATGSFVRKEAWLDILLRRHGCGRWCIVADADELLDFPGLEESGLAGLGVFLESRGWNTLHCILLDLYPPGLVSQAGYRSGDDYFDYEWYFDPFATLKCVPRHFYRGSGLDYRFEGGVRQRVFGVSNCCSKFPFFKFDAGMFLHDGQHYIEGAHVAPGRGVLYHFKYLQDFVAHAQEEVARAQHWQGAREYRRYLEACEATGGDCDLRGIASVKFTGPRQLEDLGFIEVPDGWSGSRSPKHAGRCA